VFISVKSDMKYGDIFPKTVIASLGDSYTLYCKSISDVLWIYQSLDGKRFFKINQESTRLRSVVKNFPEIATVHCQGLNESKGIFIADSFLFIGSKLRIHGGMVYAIFKTK